MAKQIKGLTDPYTGAKPCSRLYAHGHTFRWVKGDRFIAVLCGTCTESKRVVILKDHLEGHAVLEAPQPVVDTIPAPGTDWADDRLLRRLADSWARQHTHPQDHRIWHGGAA